MGGPSRTKKNRRTTPCGVKPTRGYDTGKFETYLATWRVDDSSVLHGPRAIRPSEVVHMTQNRQSADVVPCGVTVKRHRSSMSSTDKGRRHVGHPVKEIQIISMSSKSRQRGRRQCSAKPCRIVLSAYLVTK